jgi:hypothetical protein
MTKSGKKRGPLYQPSDWENRTDEEILKIRIRDLGLSIDTSIIKSFIEILYQELNRHNIQFHPPCYLADEWLCPDKEPIIGIPFCLAHPRLKHLEKKFMYEVEGGTDDSFMKLLRHEAGHAVNYAYRLYTRTRWRELFGHFSEPHSDSYIYQPYSRRFVIHLEDNYAQAHPDEDFAETFAVWLTPDSRWEERYQEWPVISKLRYIDALMKRISAQPPIVTAEETPWSASRMTSTLEAFYERKRRTMGEDFPGYYDAGLCRLFSDKPMPDHSRKAASFIRCHKRQIVNSVSMWMGMRKYDLHQLIARLMKRCTALGLYQKKSDAESCVEITAFVFAAANRLKRFDMEHLRP